MSYLNAKPLIDGLDPAAAELTLDVPSRLIGRLLGGEVEAALCSVVDYFRYADRLRLVPVSGIGCAGPTLTVRLFSRVPIDRIQRVHADTDSHTSVLLMRLLLAEQHGLRPAVVDFSARETAPDAWPETVLLIGDKVVTDAPPGGIYRHQLDLGKAWHALTGRPFVFAVWMAERGRDLGTLPGVLAERLTTNLSRIDAIVERYAADHGWDPDPAAEYLGRILRYRVGPEELAGIEAFARRLSDRGLLELTEQACAPEVYTPLPL